MINLRLRIMVIGAALAVAACSEGQPSSGASTKRAEPTGQRREAIQGGTPDVTDTFAVIVLDDQDGVCSGTLIAPNLVLTARHCVADDSGGAAVDCSMDRFAPPHAPSTLRVSTDASGAAFATAPYHVTKIMVPAETMFCGNDLALVILDKLVPASVAMPATPAIDPPLTNRKVYGSSFTGIGYGITAPMADDDGSRRKRTGIPITCIPGDATLGCDLATNDMTAGEMAAGDGLCDGDSGSGAYEATSLAAGAPIVMGVLSRAVDDGAKCTDSIFGRTDTASALLIGAARDAAVAGGYPVPAWAAPAGTVADAGADGGSTGGDGPATTADASPPSRDEPATMTNSCAMTPAQSQRARAADEARRALLAMLGVALVAGSRRRGRVAR